MYNGDKLQAVSVCGCKRVRGDKSHNTLSGWECVSGEKSLTVPVCGCKQVYMYTIAFSDIYVSVFLFKPTGGVGDLINLRINFIPGFCFVTGCMCLCVCVCVCVYVRVCVCA